MRDYNLVNRTVHALMDEPDPNNMEKTIATYFLLELDIVRYALEATNENFPREQVAAAYTNFMEFYENAKAEFSKLQQEMYSLYDEIKELENEIFQAESAWEGYYATKDVLEFQIEECGIMHPFRKAELKKELSIHLQSESSLPEWPDELFTKVHFKTQEYEQKKEMCTNLQKDFDKLEQIAKKLADKLNPVKELARNIMPKRHK